MRTLLGTLILAPWFLAGQDSGAKRPVRFAGIEWNSSKAVVTQRMEAQGFIHVAAPKNVLSCSRLGL